MIFSKSFGYAVRGVLYIALMQDEKRYIQVEEISSTLSVPRHFMGKILKRLVKENIISSSKGPYGGFRINDLTLQVKLIRFFEITDGLAEFNQCVLRLKACNSANPCPLHFKMEGLRHNLKSVLLETSLTDLLTDNKSELIKSITTAFEIENIYENPGTE
jgi:Rrf2 family iron-sulfur cluster assembly transcriptional regulator